MVPPFLRTLSARILVGFAVLILTFGATTVWIVSYIDDLAAETEVVRTGYLKVALLTKDLESRQSLLFQYLKEELPGEATPSAVPRRLRGMRANRDRLFEEVLNTLDAMRNLPRRHGERARTTIQTIENLRRAVASIAPYYETMLKAPPITRAKESPTPGVDVATVEEAQRALQRLLDSENVIYQGVSNLSYEQKRVVERIAKNLEHNADRLRRFALAMGITALVLGVMVTAWVTLNLRPLARLRDAAGRIARGEYTQRVDEGGPVEVADLGREFNVMARAIEERERELVRSERLAAVGKMAAMITHEVRNPLSSIALNTELLGDELDGLDPERSAEARALCRAITDEVDRLTAITEEYLAFARLPKPRLAPESINQVVEALATFVREDLAGRQVTVELALADALPRAMIDEAQIRQSLLNLVRNAAEALAGQGGGTIRIATRGGAPGRVEIEVADDGPGIPEEARGRLFDPFYSTKEGGTGLGLALTHQIVRDHGGEIRVESEPGSGARFVVAVPVAAQEVARGGGASDDRRTA